ncbi:hypothetical protein N7527_006479 [Penicillium freii]|nr:hypothetical protein N7527_006479 [Penicillium freii]
MRYMRQARCLLRLLPHSIKLAPYSGGLMVTWEDNEAESFRKLGGGRTEYRVVFHAEECFIARSELLHLDVVYHPNPRKELKAEVPQSRVEWNSRRVGAVSNSSFKRADGASLPL